MGYAIGVDNLGASGLREYSPSFVGRDATINQQHNTGRELINEGPQSSLLAAVVWQHGGHQRYPGVHFQGCCQEQLIEV